MDRTQTNLTSAARRPSSRHDGAALRTDDDPIPQSHRRDISHHQRPQQREPSPSFSSHRTAPRQTDNDEVGTSYSVDVKELKEQNCERIRPEEEDNNSNHHSRLPIMSSQLIGKNVTPFLREHVPGLYAPMSKLSPQQDEDSITRKPAGDANSRYCYRHRPDSKCRRAADETKMVMIQSELDKLPQADQQAITTVWSLFSAAPSKHRELMLQGVITQCCFPQLSLVSRECSEQLKIDPLTILPTEISYKILSFLDTVSLCKAAQVSRHWRELADDDVVWHRMCEQHVNRKCTKCGWGLPLLEKKRLRDWTRQRQLAKSKRQETASQDANRDITPPISPPSPPKRDASHLDEEDDLASKRQCVAGIGSPPPLDESSQEQRFLPWKTVYRDRFKVGSNWKYGRYSMKVLRGHSNGICCLQLSTDDSILATGSYDATIKIWDVATGKEIRTLRGHTRGIRSLQFDDSKLISGSLDKTIKIWNWHTGECLSTLQGSDGILSVHFAGEFLASGTIDRLVKIFNFETKETFCLRGHTDWVNQVRIDPDSRTVFSASDDCTIRLWDLDTRRCIRVYTGHVGHVQQCLLLPPDFEPDDDPATAAAQDTMDAASVASGRSGTPVMGGHTSALTSFLQQDSSNNNNNHNGYCSSASNTSDDGSNRAFYGPAFADDAERPLPPRYMLTGGLDSTLKLWDTQTGKCLHTFFGHLEGIWALAAHSTLRVVSGANDAMVKEWDPRSGRCERTFTGHRGPVTTVAISDSLMASGSEDGDVRLYSFLGAEG